MDNIHNLRILPAQQAINSVAALSQEFNSDYFDSLSSLTRLKKTIIESKFMLGQNNRAWMLTRGADFLANPKLFSSAPLTYICAFLGEIFNNSEIEEIQEQIPQAAIQHALARLDDFK